MNIQSNFEQVLWKSLVKRIHNMVPVTYHVYSSSYHETPL
jgi:hypothetical protein